MTGSSTDDSTLRGVGRPRDDTVGQRVLPVVREMLAGVGWDELSIRAVAARTGVARATITRRWPSKAELVLHAVLGDVPDLTRFDGVDRHGWVDRVVQGSRELFARADVRAAVPGLLTALDRDPQLRHRVWTGFTGPAAALFAPTAADSRRSDLDGRAVITLAAGAALFLELVADEDSAEVGERIRELLHNALRSPRDGQAQPGRMPVDRSPDNP